MILRVAKVTPTAGYLIYLAGMTVPFRRSSFILLVAMLLAASHSASAQECEKVKLTDFPKADLPTTIDTSHSMQEKLKQQGSYKFYYGIGVPVDYVRARHLAFCEMALNKEEDDPFAGPSILLMIYANGFGVKRDLDIGIRLACANIQAADAEIEGRIDHLKKLKSGELTGVIDICDDITSGYMMGFCSSVHAELAGIRRKAIIDSVIQAWPEKDREAYSSLRKVASTFFDTRVLSEVDMSGTARTAEAIGEGESLEDGFKDEILQAVKCSFDPRTEQQWKAADAKLNAVYAKIMNAKTTNLNPEPNVTKESIKATQRTWIKYRDAWVAFGAIRCPTTSAASLKTALTKERTKQLEELLEEL
jgi:uncharacterized protein YecT (DUF1311 family)